MKQKQYEYLTAHLAEVKKGAFATELEAYEGAEEIFAKIYAVRHDVDVGKDERTRTVNALYILRNRWENVWFTKSVDVAYWIYRNAIAKGREDSTLAPEQAYESKEEILKRIDVEMKLHAEDLIRLYGQADDLIYNYYLYYKSGEIPKEDN